MNTETILKNIKESFNYDDDPIPDGWRRNSKNLWITKQKLVRKGNICVRLYGKIMSQNGSIVEYGKPTGQWDCIVDGVKKEVKMATVPNNVNDSLTFNQIILHSDWNDIILVLLFNNEVEIYETSKDNFINLCKDKKIKVRWRGGWDAGIEDRFFIRKEKGDFNVDIKINIIRNEFLRII